MLELQAPPKHKNFLKKLEVSNEMYHKATIMMLAEFAYAIFPSEQEQEIFAYHVSHVMDQGWFITDPHEDEENIYVNFKVWSFIEGRYKAIPDMSSVEMDINNGFFEYYMNVN